MADSQVTTDDYSSRLHEETRNDSGVEIDDKLQKLTLDYGGLGSGGVLNRRIAIPKSRKRNDILPLAQLHATSRSLYLADTQLTRRSSYTVPDSRATPRRSRCSKTGAVTAPAKNIRARASKRTTKRQIPLHGGR